MQLTYSRFI